jgi:predicted 2-oxoglutarate/Fe(II)-dependent dioxygenase YbiX
LSPILYLNDDYTGGEIEFVHHGITIKPSPGMLVLFPANYAYSHIAHPVKTGTKYAIVTWLHDQPQGSK